MLLQRSRDERGSLALEQVLFIGAVVIMSAGLFAFYDDLRSYFTQVDFSSVPTTVSAPSGSGTTP
jgi:hypothetical protein